jgi:hypothetical protein
MNTVPLPERHLIAMPSSMPSDAVQQIWFACQRRPWLTLAVVGPEARDGALLLATALATVGRMTCTGEVDLLNVQGAQLAEVARHVEAMRHSAARAARLVIATDPVVESPLSLPILRAADAPTVLN